MVYLSFKTNAFHIVAKVLVEFDTKYGLLESLDIEVSHGNHT